MGLAPERPELQPTDTYHVEGEVIDAFGSMSTSKISRTAQPFLGVAPDGTTFSAHLWLGYKILGSTANECQFGGTIAH